MITCRGLFMGSVLVLSAALASQTCAASAAGPEPVCYTDDICLEWRGKSDTVNGEETIIAFTQKNRGSFGTGMINCDKGEVTYKTLSKNIITLEDAEQRAEEYIAHFCAP